MYYFRLRLLSCLICKEQNLIKLKYSAVAWGGAGGARAPLKIGELKIKIFNSKEAR